MLARPHALLLDFGGVIAEAPEHPEWPPAMIAAVTEVLSKAGAEAVPPADILRPLIAGESAEVPFWRSPAPLQRDHASYWGEIVAAGWPPAARAAVVRQAGALSRRLMEIRYANGWRLRPGMAELLADANRRGLPMAVVSNTICGAVHREFLDRVGVAGRFVAQLYSDEEGVRKPNPALAERAVAAVNVPADKCWFVGDTLTRDMLVARRAELGAAVLMRSLRVERPPHPDGVVPDAVVADPVELHSLLARHW
jgi:FMN phosphatase YigB (HAD superfamily)